MRRSPALLLVLLAAACVSGGVWYVMRAHEMARLDSLRIEQAQLNDEAHRVVLLVESNDALEKQLGQLRGRP